MHFTEEHILDAIENLLSDSSSADGFALVDADKLMRLKQVASFARMNNAKARNLWFLTKMALETQEACNPRPVSVMLCNIIHTVMQNGGNPAFETSPAVRVALNTLLNIFKFRSLPHYDDGYAKYSKDIESMEALLKEEFAA